MLVICTETKVVETKKCAIYILWDIQIILAKKLFKYSATYD